MFKIYHAIYDINRRTKRCQVFFFFSTQLERSMSTKMTNGMFRNTRTLWCKVWARRGKVGSFIGTGPLLSQSELRPPQHLCVWLCKKHKVFKQKSLMWILKFKLNGTSSTWTIKERQKVRQKILTKVIQDNDLCCWNKLTKEESLSNNIPSMILSFWYDTTWSHNDVPALALVVTQFHRPENRTLQEETLQHNHLLPQEAPYTSTHQYTVQIDCKWTELPGILEGALCVRSKLH